MKEKKLVFVDMDMPRSELVNYPELNEVITVEGMIIIVKVQVKHNQSQKLMKNSKQ